MPKSPLRRKTPYTPPQTRSAADLPSPRWVAWLMVGLFLAGLLWIVVYYVTQADWPIKTIGDWNLLAGFGFIGLGFMVATRWR